VAELGNPTAGILLSPWRMSTVKIRAGSLFRTPPSRIGPAGAGFGLEAFGERPYPSVRGFKVENSFSTSFAQIESLLHRLYTGIPCFALAGGGLPGAKSRRQILEQGQSRADEGSKKEGLKLIKRTPIKTAAEVCPLCEGTGWRSLPATSSAPRDRRVTRCDCQLRARNQTLLAAARIPRRYEHCELASYTTDFPGAHPSLAFAHLSASKFAQEYDPGDGTGLLIIGKIGTGKTHLAVGITKELILNKGISCMFYDYRELLKEIQNSYNATVQTTELDVLRPIFETDVLVLDELGAVKPTEWVWDTVSLILNTRYNDNRTTIITTNFEDQPAAGAGGSISPARAASRSETLGDRIGERMRSRLHEMCRVIKMEGEDFRQKFRSASFR
jgi:DNA replication protein DnaC